MKNKEIEIQVQIEKSQALLEFLKREAVFKSENHQIDEYFTPPDRNFLAVRPIGEWLRLRNQDGVYSINYKNWHTEQDGRSHHCDEYESKVEDIDQLQKILKALSHTSLVVVDKTRQVWTYNEWEIDIDTVTGLGDFVEIEYKGADEAVDPKAVTEKMIQFLQEVGCGEIKRNYVGYPFQLLFPDEVAVETQ